MRLLILTATAGEGHNSLSHALKDYIRKNFQYYEVIVYDLYKENHKLFALIINDLHFSNLKHFPHIMRFQYKLSLENKVDKNHNGSVTFGRIAQKDLLLEMIDDLVIEDGKHNPDILLEKVASMSCKAAVKGNQSMSYSEFDALVEELLTLDNPYNCPHGRPTIISMTKYEIEKKFKRII